MTGKAPAETSGPAKPPRPRGLRRIKLPEWILIGLVGGIVTGLFLGEYAARLELLGDVYVGLLQMTVLPYIVVSLISGIGKLGKRQARLLLGGVVVVLLLLYLIGMVTVAAVSTAYPPEESASFFSSSLVEEPPEVDFLRLFIPKNVFRSLAEDQVPAIVLFCLLLGVALMGVKGKQQLLGIFDVVAAALSRVTGYTVLVSPLGVFFIAAAAAGTLGVEDIGRLQGYLITSTIAALGLALGLLPLLITSTTPFRLRDLAPILRSSLLLAFATGKTLVVLPMLIEGLKKMFEDNDLGGDETTSTIEILVPLGYSFPTLGRILSSIYVPFAAWFIGSPLKAADYPPLLGLGFFSHFSGATVAIPFQLDLMQRPPLG